MDLNFKGKTVIITGAAIGLGKAFAEAFVERGAQVAICDINLEAAQKTAVELGASATAYAMDVSNAAQVEAVVASIHQSFGSIDVLVNNAAMYGNLSRAPFYEITEKEWDKVMQVNIKGPWLLAKACFPYMKKIGGKIVNISSATFMSGSPNWSHYVSSKGAVIGMTRTLAKECGPFNINVNAVAPGFTLTEASLSIMENAATYGVDRGSIKRSSTSEDIVGTVLYLSSSLAAYVTGQTIIVDGGKQFI
ncbi:MAG: SDR family oxidoreductase [Flavobacteriales bacterium]|nr:SDR family oxidoreductase [Flavobacteriales bacterium]